MTELSYANALTEVKALVIASRSSFFAGMALLPKDRREAMYALYAFCRIVDDIADESASQQEAASGLMTWRRRISSAFQGKADDAVTVVLLPAIKKFGLVEKDFQDIIDGMEMDATAIVAPDFSLLDKYCDLVASAVGRASVRIFGDSSDNAIKTAYHLGRALQLTNILRDIHEDCLRGRLYLPKELLEKHQISTSSANDALENPSIRSVCHDLAIIARDYYFEADRYMNLCPDTAMRPAKIMRLYYGAIFDALLENDWANMDKRVSLSKWKKAFLLIKGYLT